MKGVMGPKIRAVIQRSTRFLIKDSGRKYFRHNPEMEIELVFLELKHTQA
jgi:hypothetical protein